MTNRFKTLFEKQKAFVGYLTLGDGGLSYSEEAFLALIEGGVDIIEIGMPFSEPIADGVLIQRAMIRALKHNISIDDVFYLVEKLRKKISNPIVLMTYANPFIQKPMHEVLLHANQSQLDAILIDDMPFYESNDFISHCTKHDVDPIFVAAMTTPMTRVQEMTKHSQAFLYYACQKGTTGPREYMPEHFQEQVKQVKQNSLIPVVVGFGISNRAMAHAALENADGFVVGSMFVRAIEEGATPEQLCLLAKQIDPR